MRSTPGIDSTGMRLPFALGDEHRPDQIGGREHVLRHQPPRPPGLAVAPHAHRRKLARLGLRRSPLGHARLGLGATRRKWPGERLHGGTSASVCVCCDVGADIVGKRERVARGRINPPLRVVCWRATSERGAGTNQAPLHSSAAAGSGRKSDGAASHQTMRARYPARRRLSLANLHVLNALGHIQVEVVEVGVVGFGAEHGVEHLAGGAVGGAQEVGLAARRRRAIRQLLEMAWGRRGGWADIRPKDENERSGEPGTSSVMPGMPMVTPGRRSSGTIAAAAAGGRGAAALRLGWVRSPCSGTMLG